MAKEKKVTKKGEEPIPPKLQNTSADSDTGAADEGASVGKKDKGASGVEVKDYLRQYQYKRETPLGDPTTDPQPGGKSAAMKSFLLSQPKITILIPLEEGSDPKVPYSVNLNGYRLDLPTNTYVEVPQQVAEVIMQSQKQTVAALEQNKIGGGSTQEDALS